MGITPGQRERRKSHLGSSDAAAIAGLDPWRNSGDVFLEKTQDLPEVESSDAMEVGTLCEEAVLKFFCKETGKKLRRNQNRVHANGILAANLDAIVEGLPEICEAKTAGIITPFDRDQWGEPMSDQVPERVILQTQHQLAVMGEDFRVAWVPVLLGGIGFRLYRIDRNDQLIDQLVGMEVNFWREYVLKRTPPPDSIPSFEILKRIRRQPSKVVPVADEIVQEWQAAKNLEKVAREGKEEAERALLAALGDAEGGSSSLGDITYLEQARKEFVMKASTFRVLRFRKTKEISNEE